MLWDWLKIHLLEHWSSESTRPHSCHSHTRHLDWCIPHYWLVCIRTPVRIEQTEWPAESCLSSFSGSLLFLTASTGKYLTWDKFHITKRSKIVSRNGTAPSSFGGWNWTETSEHHWPSDQQKLTCDFTDHCLGLWTVYVILSYESSITELLFSLEQSHMWQIFWIKLRFKYNHYHNVGRHLS